MRRAATIAFAVSASAAVHAAPPLEVKGVQLGANMAELQTAMPGLTCSRQRSIRPRNG